MDAPIASVSAFAPESWIAKLPLAQFNAWSWLWGNAAASTKHINALSLLSLICLYLGLSPFPVIVEMKVYRDCLLNMKQSWWSLLLGRGTTQPISVASSRQINSQILEHPRIHRYIIAGPIFGHSILESGMQQAVLAKLYRCRTELFCSWMFMAVLNTDISENHIMYWKLGKPSSTYNIYIYINI